ncbi:hypothetical protein [Edaphobacter aggregans]|uniref:hypothetical protein n=1 Tax=Edaphobacter aggregans TaxID=570835 RepID=UPI000559681E|nr:hypothetical protein [Edaphobacter aggregans]
MLSDVDFENLSRGIQPDCRDHIHVGKARAFELTGNPSMGRVLAFLTSSATTDEDLAPAGCFIEIGGFVEYAHLRKTTKPNLKAIYAVGEKVAADEKKPFMRRTFYPVA